MAKPKKNPFATFDKAVDESTLLDFEKEALKNNFRQIVEGLTSSMDFVSMQNGRNVSLSTDYATAQNNFIRNLSNIAIQKFFVEEDYEPLVLYTDTVAGPDGDLREALLKDCSKIREFMEKGYYRRDKVRDTVRGMLTRRQFTGEDSKSFAGLKLPRLDITSPSTPESSSKYNVGTAKYFMALTRHGEIMTADEYNDHMEQVLDINYASYRNVKGIISQFMDALQTKGYQYRDGDFNIVTVDSFTNDMTPEQIDKKRQEVMTRLNATFYDAMREGRPIIFDIKYNKSTKKYEVGGDLQDILGSAFCNNYGKDMAEWFETFGYGTTRDQNGKIAFTYAFIKDSACPLQDLAKYGEAEWGRIASAQGYTPKQMVNFTRAIKVATGKAKRYKPELIPAMFTEQNNPFSQQIVPQVRQTPVETAESQPVTLKNNTRKTPADPSVIGISRVKLYPPYKVEGFKKVVPISGVGVESLYSTQAYETFSNFKRNNIIEMMQDQDERVTSSRIKSLSILDSVVDDLTIMSSILYSAGSATQMTPEEIVRMQAQVDYQLHELIYQRLASGETVTFEVVDGVPSQDLLEIYKGTPAEGVITQALETAGGLAIPQDDDQGKSAIPVGKIIVSDQGVAFKKPLVQADGPAKTSTTPVQ